MARTLVDHVVPVYKKDLPPRSKPQIDIETERLGRGMISIDGRRHVALLGGGRSCQVTHGGMLADRVLETDLA
jgi:hypothetical protein